MVVPGDEGPSEFVIDLEEDIRVQVTGVKYGKPQVGGALLRCVFDAYCVGLVLICAGCIYLSTLRGSGGRQGSKSHGCFRCSDCECKE